MNTVIYEAELTEKVLGQLIDFSEDWEKESSCHGYVRNGRSDIEGNRVFLAETEGKIVGYLFGHAAKAEKCSSIMEKDTPYFEIEELYVTPENRSKGIGGMLFKYAEEKARADGLGMISLGTANKNFRAILNFYIDEMGMEFWSARLFKRI